MSFELKRNKFLCPITMRFFLALVIATLKRFGLKKNVARCIAFIGSDVASENITISRS